jgi:phosphorylcholine metabolism protein LicD
MQDICQEVLNFIVNVCEKHGIEYWLEGGTLLGAVRHGGFLPWDDDIDLGMMRKDYELFIEVFDSELKNHNLEKQMKWKLLRHNDNVLYFIQVSYADFAVSDIFPYDYIENPPENIQDMYDVEKSKFKSNILEGKSYSQALDELYSNLDLSRDEKPFVIPGVERPGPSPFHVQNTEELFPLTKVKFNNYEYLAHKNNDYHLKKLYGDWKNLPKVIDRHNRMYKLKERENINEDLEEKANLLREINNSFNS